MITREGLFLGAGMMVAKHALAEVEANGDGIWFSKVAMWVGIDEGGSAEKASTERRRQVDDVWSHL